MAVSERFQIYTPRSLPLPPFWRQINIFLRCSRLRDRHRNRVISPLNDRVNRTLTFCCIQPLYSAEKSGIYPDLQSYVISWRKRVNSHGISSVDGQGGKATSYLRRLLEERWISLIGNFLTGSNGCTARTTDSAVSRLVVNDYSERIRFRRRTDGRLSGVNG